MPNRILKESICTSEQVDVLSTGAECLFYRLLTKADDYGRYFADVRLIKAAVFPLKDSYTIEQVTAWLKELKDCGIIMNYKRDERWYLCFVNWEKHQSVRNVKSKFPAPDSYVEQSKSIEINCNQTQANVPVFGIQSNPIQSESNPIPTHTNAGAWEAKGYDKPDSLEQIEAFANMKGYSKDVAERYWNKRRSTGWTKAQGQQQVPIADWRADFASIASYLKTDLAKEGAAQGNGTNGHHKTNHAVPNIAKITEQVNRLFLPTTENIK